MLRPSIADSRELSALSTSPRGCLPSARCSRPQPVSRPSKCGEGVIAQYELVGGGILDRRELVTDDFNILADADQRID